MLVPCLVLKIRVKLGSEAEEWLLSAGDRLGLRLSWVTAGAGPGARCHVLLAGCSLPSVPRPQVIVP